MPKINLLKSQIRKKLEKYFVALAIEEQFIKAVEKLKADPLINIEKPEKPGIETTKDPKPVRDFNPDTPNWYKIIKTEREEVEC